MGSCKTEYAAIAGGFTLTAKYIFHVVGPI
ncbi:MULTISPECIES: macro domain-containing protein [Blautia]